MMSAIVIFQFVASWLETLTIIIQIKYRIIFRSHAFSEMPANVEYHELDLEPEFPARHLKYIPNIEYSWNHQEDIPR